MGIPSFTPSNSAQWTVILAPALTLPFTVSAVVMRFHSRYLTRQKIGIDDWLILLALILLFGLYLDMVICVVWGGLGISVFTLTPKTIEVFAKAGAVVSGILWGAAVTVTQLSILFFYVRLFGVTKWHRFASYTLMVLCVCWFIGLVGGLAGQCVPLKKLWMPKHSGKCTDQRKFCTGTGFSHVVLDLLILVLAIPPIWKLQTSIARRLRALSILTLGVIATLFSLLRISCVFGLVKITYGDVTRSVWLSFTFETLEVILGILCACIPTLIPALKQAQNSRLGSYAKRLLTTSSQLSRGTVGGSQKPSSQWYNLSDRSKSQTALKSGNSIEGTRDDTRFEEPQIHVQSTLEITHSSNRL